MGVSIWKRKCDFVYLAYFCIHLPIMFAIDLTTLYPASLIPAFSTAIKEYHITTFSDQFFVEPPQFFIFFMWMEVFFHVPICGWGIWGLVHDHPQTPLIILIYGLQTFITTAVCIWDYMHWPNTSMEVKWGLTSLYGPYIALSCMMIIDATLRISRVLSTNAVLTQSKKKN